MSEEIDGRNLRYRKSCEFNYNARKCTGEMANDIHTVYQVARLTLLT